MRIVDETTHIFVCLTPHGYGHAAMTAPLVEELRARVSNVRITVQSGLPEEWLRSRIDGPFDLVAETPDFGARMLDAIRVDLPGTLADYAALHADLGGVVAREAALLRSVGADMVISNVSYIALAAAAEAGIPGVGLGCFTWADILAGCGGAKAAPLVAEMNACYGRADVMLRAEPAMDMAGLGNVQKIGPIARRTPCRRQALGVGQGERIGLIGFGGIGLPMPLSDWARLPGWRWLASEEVPGREDFSLWQDTGLSFSEVLASVDVMVTKPGYGTFTECAVNGTPVLTLGRPEWPETPYLMAWLERHGRVVEVAAETLTSPSLKEQLLKLFSLPVKPLPEPTGAVEAAQAAISALRRRQGNRQSS